jgi:ribosomal protein S18 acetylase RimI-like enzyme
MRIEVFDGPPSELTAALETLVPQLSKSNPPPTEQAVASMLGSDVITQFVARDDEGAIVGVSTLVVFRIPTGMRAWIEDVVVDDGAAGHGIGTALTLAMLDAARSAGCVTVDLTSRPSREAANHVYAKVGFVARETNLYRYDLRTPPPA